MNQLTPEQLDMIKRLQPLFTSKVREWIDDDLCYCNQCGNHVLTYEKHSQRCPVEPIFIPKPIDWQNPERGLWNMLDSSNRYADKIMCDDPFTALLKALAEQEGV